MRVPIVAMAAIVMVFANTPAGAQPLPAPTRPLPSPSNRPLPDSHVVYVDATRGDDDHAGSRDQPFRTLARAARDLKPGDTVCLRGGVHYGHVIVASRGAADQPITVRSFPGELAILDGGLREFVDDPGSAWEVCPDGVAGEFRSAKVFPDLHAGRGGDADGDGTSHVFGNFADTMVPLQAYRFRGDLQSDNPYWNVANKVGKESYVYCGPGIWYDAATGRIHCRLAHTTLAAHGDNGYRGPTDPRQVKLVIAGRRDHSPLTLDRAEHVRLQDLIIRGGAGPALLLETCRHIELDHVTVYGGASCIAAKQTRGLRMAHTALRGIAAPWTFRGSLKYRSVEARLLSGGPWTPTGVESTDWEFAYCEFTDSVDGVFIGNVRRVRIHQSLLDNVSDDGFFCTAATGYDGQVAGGDVQVYQNCLARTLTTFAFGVGHGRQMTTANATGTSPPARQTGSGIHIYRNVFDFRRPVMYYWPKSADDPLGIHSLGRFAGDHGGPTWEPMFIYHNTILAGDTPRYDYLTDGVGKAVAPGTVRRVFNNIVMQKIGLPGGNLPKPEADFIGDGNLYWTADAAAQAKADPLAKARKSPVIELSKARYGPGWTASDLWTDPKLTAYAADSVAPVDVSLASGSPAIGSGVKIPADWPDPLRGADAEGPDRGAIPQGVEAWRIGVNGRMTVDGRPVAADAAPVPTLKWDLPWDKVPAPKAAPAGLATAAVFTGYPAFDEPIISYLLRQQGTAVELFERTFPPADQLAKYDLVAIDGSMIRAKLEKTVFADEDLPKVRAFLENGGTLLLMRERTDIFKTDAGRAFLKEIGIDKIQGSPRFQTGDTVPAPLQLKVGKGQLIYFSWSPAADMPNGREKSTVEMEAKFLAAVEQLRQSVGRR